MVGVDANRSTPVVRIGHVQLSILLRDSDKSTLQSQIVDQIRIMFLNRQLRGYDPLPTTLKLSAQLGAPRNTVMSTKINMNYHRVYSHAVDKETGLRFDQTIALDGFYSQRRYPQHLRRVGFIDPETSKRLVFLTNNFALPALTICALYKARWQVELFFKWIKQNLRLRHFYGASENAVKTQIWTAVCVYVLAAIIKKELALDVSLYTFLQILSVHSFEKIQLSCAFQGGDAGNSDDPFANQMNLFDS